MSVRLSERGPSKCGLGSVVVVEIIAFQQIRFQELIVRFISSSRQCCSDWTRRPDQRIFRKCKLGWDLSGTDFGSCPRNNALGAPRRNADAILDCSYMWLPTAATMIASSGTLFDSGVYSYHNRSPPFVQYRHVQINAAGWPFNHHERISVPFPLNAAEQSRVSIHYVPSSHSSSETERKKDELDPYTHRKKTNRPPQQELQLTRSRRRQRPSP